MNRLRKAFCRHSHQWSDREEDLKVTRCEDYGKFLYAHEYPLGPRS